MVVATELTKQFGQVVAVRNVGAEFSAGRIHALFGENGAGKSTVLRILAGRLKPDRGSIEMPGEERVGFVEQHFSLVDTLSVLENVVLSVPPQLLPGVVDFRGARSRLFELCERLQLTVDPNQRVGELSLVEKQKVEVVRALFSGARVLLLDEPTAVLSPEEVDRLFSVLLGLRAEGLTIVLVTHRLSEIQRYVDDVTVLRHGEVVGRFSTNTRLNEDEMGAITRCAMGREPPNTAHTEPLDKKEPILVCANVQAGLLSGLTLSVGRGEVLGVAGISGNGQEALFDVLSGARRLESGSIVIRGRPLRAFQGQRVHPVVRLAEDRHKNGLLLSASVEENLLLGELSRYLRFGLVVEHEAHTEAKKRLAASGAVPRELGVRVSALSGGNQQKVLMERAISRVREEGCVLLLWHPTRGVDLMSRAEIHSRIRSLSKEGVAILLLTHDLDELRTLSHRVCVMVRGTISAEFEPGVDDETLGRAMLGEAR